MPSAAPGPDGDDTRYRAFVSYSHRDAGAARWLHRKLEAYRMPRRLVGAKGRHGPVPPRLGPIFRDLEELVAAQDLTAEVRAALAASDALIVLCSPAAAASLWVAREIEAFRELCPGRPILAALVDGEPAEAMPAALTTGPEGGHAEPLAADLRKQGGSRRFGFLKLAAGLSGVGLDALVQRDTQRRLRRVMAVTALAVAAMLAMGMLTIMALAARAEADRQRAEAEGLIEFMLTDLRDRLEGVGRLDILTTVNQRALSYYRGQARLGELSVESLERRARVLHAMGEDDEKRGRLDLALNKFREAHRATAALLARDPGDPLRIFAHSQSEYWIGYADYQRGRYAQALPAFRAYKALADRLVVLQPDNAEYRREAGYAEGNLCSLALTEPVDAPAALKACRAALDQMTSAALGLPADQRESIRIDIANRHAWLGTAYKTAGDMPRSLAEFAAQERIIRGLMAGDPQNMRLRDIWLTIQFTAAEREAGEGRRDLAQARLRRALPMVDGMIAFDPANDQWVRRRERILTDIARYARN